MKAWLPGVLGLEAGAGDDRLHTGLGREAEACDARRVKARGRRLHTGLGLEVGAGDARRVKARGRRLRTGLGRETQACDDRRVEARRRLSGLVMLAVSGCGGAPPVAEPMHTVDIPGAGLQLEVPAGARVVAEEGRPGARIELRPGARSPRPLEIEATAAAGDRLGLRVELPRALLRCRVEASDGGMGGPELVLVGRVALADREWAVRCADQDEARPSLAWCLAALRTLRPGSR